MNKKAAIVAAALTALGLLAIKVIKSKTALEPITTVCGPADGSTSCLQGKVCKTASGKSGTCGALPVNGVCGCEDILSQND